MSRAAPPFELNPRSAPARAVRQAALAQLDHALQGLERGDDKAIHEARKVCKKLRALLRLIRPFLGSAYRAENRRLRDVGRALAHGRDTTVLIQTSEKLRRNDGCFAAIAMALRRRPQPELALPLTEARRLLQTERRRVVEWPVRDLAAGSVLVGLVSGYRSARRGFRAAVRMPNPPVLHEWRKQAKYHGYQCGLASAILPAGHDVRLRRLKRLGDALGDHHDLAMLSEALRRSPAEFGGRETIRRARAHLAVAQQLKARAALSLGRDLFRYKPLDWLAAEAVR